MKSKILLGLLLILSGNSFGQWNTQLGINVIPLFIKTLDVSAEFSKHPGFSITTGAGATFNTHYEGLVTGKEYYGVEQMTSSGAFAKLGGKLYMNNLSGSVHNNVFFMGANLVFSHYRHDGLEREYDQETSNYTDHYDPVSDKGMRYAATLTFGFYHHLSKKFSLEWGAQMPFNLNDEKANGFGPRYYPGLGTDDSDISIQGILMLKYKI